MEKVVNFGLKMLATFQGLTGAGNQKKNYKIELNKIIMFSLILKAYKAYQTEINKQNKFLKQNRHNIQETINNYYAQP